MRSTQQSIEQRFREIHAAAIPPEASAEAVFGPIEHWELSLGKNRILLMPTVGEWLWLDPTHQSWEHTGIGVGEVIFAERDGAMVIDRRVDAPPPRPDLGPDRWLVRGDQGVTGPFSRSQISAAVARGEIGRRALIQRQGTAPWLRAEILVDAPRSVSVYVTQGPNVLQRFVITGAAVIGSGAGSAVCLEDPRVAPAQAELVPSGDGGWLLRDLGSGRRTYLNEAPVTGATPIHDGDEIDVGSTKLRFQS